MEKVKNAIDRTVSSLLTIIMAVMVFNVTWQVFSRYVIQSPSSYTDELSRYLLIWLGMLGAAYVAGKNEHLAIDILPQKVRGITKVRLLVFIHLAIIAFVIPVMIMGGGNLVYITYTLQQKSATLGLPLAFVYLIIPISGLLVLFYQVAEIRKILTQPITQTN